MATIVTRTAKGSALTITELDANFTNLNTAKIETETNDLTAAVTWANVPDANITQSSVTQHQAALTITESQISDLSHTTSLPFSSITSTPTTIAGYGITDAATQYANTDVDAHLNTSTAASSEVLSWTGTDYDWVAQSGGIALTDISVTQNAAGTAALSYNNTTGVLTYTPPDLSGYLTSYTETNDLSAAVTWANVPDANITQSSVTQHQAALSITESQISDLSHTTSLPFASITSTPTTLSGYGITDGYANSDVDLHLNTSTATTGQVLSWTGTDYDWITGGAGGGISNLVEDTTPQLGGMLDVNGNSIGDGTLELLKFTETASAVNEITIANSATGSGPSISATGDDANIDITFASKGTGLFRIGAAANDTKITSPGAYNLTLGTNSFSNTSTITINSNANGNNIVMNTNGAGDIVLGNYTFDGDQTVGATEDNYVMTYDHATGKISLEASAGGGGGGGLANIVEDLTPQLGGDLELNGFDIINDNASAARGDVFLIGSDNTPGVNTSHGVGAAQTTYNLAFNANGRVYPYGRYTKLRFDNEGTTNIGTNGRFRNNYTSLITDVNGCSYGANVGGRGLIATYLVQEIHNANDTYSVDLPRIANFDNQMWIAPGYDIDYNLEANAQDMNIDVIYSNWSSIRDDGAGSGSTARAHITDEVAMYYTDGNSIDGNSASIVWDTGAKAYNIKNQQPNYLEKFGSIDQYSEHAEEFTHSTTGTYTLNYRDGNTQLITLGANITSFTMSNFPGTNNITGFNMIGSVTLFLQQDGTGGRTISFTAGAGETFKIANGVTTADTGANNITVAHVMKVGSTYLWTISGNYI